MAVGRGQGAAAPVPAQGLVVLEVDDRGDGGAEGFFPQVPIGAPGQAAVGQLGDLGHCGRAEVAPLRQDRGVQVYQQVFGAGLTAAGMLEVAGESGPAVDLEEQVGQVDPGQVLGDLLLQRDTPFGRVLGRERGEHQASRLEPHHVVLRPVAVEPGQLLLQLGPALLQPGRSVLGELKQVADVPAVLGPPFSRDQVRVGVGEPAAGGQPDITGPQRGPEFPEHAQLVVMAVVLTVPVDDVGTPPGRHELDRGVWRHLPLAPGVHVTEPLDGLQDRGPGPVGLERKGIEELGRELAEIVVAVGQEVELVAVPAAGQGLGPLHGLAERLPGDPAVDRRPQLAVGDRRVEHDAADLAEEPDGLVGRLGVRQAELLQLALGPCRGPGQAAVEQVDDLVGGLLQGLAEECDEDGVAPLVWGPLQGLVGRALAQPGQELEPVGVQRLEIPAVDPPADQGGPPFQGREDRGGGGGDLPQGQRPLKRCSGKDFQQIVIAPTAATTFHDQARAVGILL